MRHHFWWSGFPKFRNLAEHYPAKHHTNQIRNMGSSSLPNIHPHGAYRSLATSLAGSKILALDSNLRIAGSLDILDRFLRNNHRPRWILLKFLGNVCISFVPPNFFLCSIVIHQKMYITSNFYYCSYSKLPLLYATISTEWVYFYESGNILVLCALMWT